jgi:predicted transglutaminase-like cysteine proteinase
LARVPASPVMRGAMLALALILAVADKAVAEFTQSGPDIFNTLAIRSENLAPFPKWRGSLERYFSESRTPRPPCTSGMFTRCPVEDWKGFLSSIAGRSPADKLREVNYFHNRTRYVLDVVNWQVEDYWASPFQFFDKDGDCEDYAIAKFMSLRALGFANSQMRIVVLRDLNLRVAHAVLVVELDGEKYILDNQIRDVVPASLIRHYQPIYSINETHWWLHRRA